MTLRLARRIDVLFDGLYCSYGPGTVIVSEALAMRLRALGADDVTVIALAEPAPGTEMSSAAPPTSEPDPVDAQEAAPKPETPPSEASIEPAQKPQGRKGKRAKP